MLSAMIAAVFALLIFGGLVYVVVTLLKLLERVVRALETIAANRQIH